MAIVDMLPQAGGVKLLYMIDACVTADTSGGSGDVGTHNDIRHFALDPSYVSFSPNADGAYYDAPGSTIFYTNILKSVKVNLILLTTSSGTAHPCIVNHIHNGTTTTLFNVTNDGMNTVSGISLEPGDQLTFKILGHSNQNSVQGRALLVYAV